MGALTMRRDKKDEKIRAVTDTLEDFDLVLRRRRSIKIDRRRRDVGPRRSPPLPPVELSFSLNTCWPS